MPTIIEHDIQHDDGTASSLVALVAIVAIFFVIGIAMYVLRVFPFNTVPLADATVPPSVNLNINGPLPSSDPTEQ
ncbi:hypothetical protein AUJ46_05225 [Candidatus Peregrinibacteria bacterium CG1_02_54_53]|nr:MAG: hypothetical protein AUJ46_05225 [Candidatus Peregrinibacteria bacterium CG1_02_54_53]